MDVTLPADDADPLAPARPVVAYPPPPAVGLPPAPVTWYPASPPMSSPPPPTAGYPRPPVIGYPPPPIRYSAPGYPPPPPGYPDLIAYPYRPPPPPLRRGTWLRVVSMLVAVAVVIGGMQVFAHLRNEALLGPDGSGVVVRMSADELPAPEILHREVPAPGFEEAGRPLGIPPRAPTSSEYAFIDIQRDGAGNTVPVSWSPCRPIHVVVDETGAPEGFLDEVVAALGATSLATGLVFVTDGLTTEAASEDRAAFLPTLYGDRWAPVLVRFTDEREVAALKGDVVGLSSTQSYEDVRTGVVHYVSGTVYLDSDLLQMRGVGGLPAYVQVLRHELGHMVGLDHVDEYDQLMYPNANRVVTFQDGDLAGLAQLGAGACAPGL